VKNLSVYVLVLSVSVTNTFHMANGDDQLNTLRVLWTVNEYKIIDKSKASERDASALLSMPLDIGETSITFDGNTCSNVSFQKHDVDSKDYFSSHFDISPQEVGVKDARVQVVRTSCGLPGFSEYVRLPNRQLIVFRNGVLLVFSPWVNY
jgi:hypothetical protein